MDQRLHLPDLLKHRAGATSKLTAAFCDVPDYVLGCAVQPITLRTFSMLMASRNRFVTGGIPLLDDVIYFIWFHSSRYVPAHHPSYRWRKWLALRPMTRVMRGNAEHWATALVMAIGEIREILEQAFACATRGKPGPVIACLEAQMIHVFAQAYHWTPEVTRSIPLRQLFQLDRCLSRSRGVDVQDISEDEIVAAHLTRKNAAALAAKGVSCG